MVQHATGTPAEWLKARKALLEREKQFSRLRNEIAEERRALPWVKVEKPYVFDTPSGKKTLGELFGKNSQLIIYHFMLAPGWEAGCSGCSFLADHFDSANQHIKHHDVTLMAVSRAPLGEIEAYKKRMGWQFDWASSNGSDFNYDFHVSFRKEDVEAGRATYNFAPTSENPGEEAPGFSAFYRDENGDVFHTYSSYARGNEEVIGAYMLLDFAPKGRNETEIMDWMRRHDEYEDAPARKSA